MLVKRNYIIDVKTSNMSFLQTAADLKKLGIKNNMFFLILYDVSLQGVDPHSPKLTEDQMFRIINECLINPWYFFREVCRIPDQGNVKGIPFSLNRANLAMFWCGLNNIDSYLTIPRQIGKTQSAIALINWVFLFGTTNSEMMFANKRSEDAINNLNRLKEQRDLLPQFLQFKVALDNDGKMVKGTDNVKTLSNRANNNKIVTKPSAKSVESAEQIGRGNTQTVQYLDEVEFTDHIKTIMEAAGPAFATASRNAKRNNAATFRILTSTPGDLDSRAGQEAMAILDNTCKWSEKFYDKDIEDVREYIDKNSRNGIVYIEYQYKQLGKDETWFKEMCKVVEQNPMKIKREILLQRLHGSSLSPYDTEDLAHIVDMKGKIIEEIFITSIFKLNVYSPLARTKCYFIGVDVSNGYGADSSAVTVWDPYEMKTVAEFNSPNIGVTELHKFLKILVKRYLPRSILIIERNANGNAVIEQLRASEVSHCLYWDNTKDIAVDEKLDTAGFVKYEAQRRKLYGVWTGKNSRQLMFDLLATHVSEHKDKFVGEYIISELLTLVRTKTGKIEASDGKHDDSIMSYLMCLYVYYYGKNLSRYGYIRGSIPDEEKRNTGLIYEEITSLMSDNDKEFFKGVTYESVADGLGDFDIKSLIENRRKETSMNIENERKEKNNLEREKTPEITKSMYDLKLQKEYEDNLKEIERFNHSYNFVNIAKPVDYEVENEYIDFDSTLFDELNS